MYYFHRNEVLVNHGGETIKNKNIDLMKNWLVGNNKYFYYLLLISSLFGCKDDPKKMLGHWHRIDSTGLYQTVDITDSTFAIDQFTFGGVENICDWNVDTIGLGGVLLIKNSMNQIIAFEDSQNWVKVENNMDDFVKDLSSGLFIQYVPDETSKKNDDDTSKFRAAHLYIGKLKTQFKYLAENKNLYSKNDYYIQSGGLLTRDDLECSLLEIDRFYIKPRKSILLLCVDKNCPKEIIEDIIQIRKERNLDFFIFIRKINVEKKMVISEKLISE